MIDYIFNKTNISLVIFSSSDSYFSKLGIALVLYKRINELVGNEFFFYLLFHFNFPMNQKDFLLQNLQKKVCIICDLYMLSLKINYLTM